MLIISDVARQILPAIIQNIERKISEEYEAVTMRNLIKMFQPTYPFLHDIEIKNTSFFELESNMTL
jgi:hypothetical protein